MERPGEEPQREAARGHRGAHERMEEAAVEEGLQAPRCAQEVEGVLCRRRVDDDQVVALGFDQGLDLGHGAADSPGAAHLAERRDEPVLGFQQRSLLVFRALWCLAHQGKYAAGGATRPPTISEMIEISPAPANTTAQK